MKKMHFNDSSKCHFLNILISEASFNQLFKKILFYTSIFP